jgi:hypothetical protein
MKAMKAMKLGLAVGVSLLTVGTPKAARADVVTFTFETLATQSGLTTLTLTGGGLTATLTRPGSTFGIIDLSAGAGFGVPASWGARSLDFEDTGNTPFVLNFSQGISGLSIDMGRFGDAAEVLSLQLFSGLNGTGTLLGSSSIPLAAGPNFFSLQTPSVTTATPALSARFIGGNSSLPNSVFYDNIVATFNGPATTAAPETGRIVLVVYWLIVVGAVRRRRRTAA